MNFENVSTKKTSSTILNLENLASEYNTILNTYNQIQLELNAFADSQMVVNPYLNTNILFTTGEIAYVTNNGTVMLYDNPSSAYSLQQDYDNISQTELQINNENQQIDDADINIENINSELYANQQDYNDQLAAYSNEIQKNFDYPYGWVDFDIAISAKQAELNNLFSPSNTNLNNQIANEKQEISSDNQVNSYYYGVLNTEYSQLDSDSAFLAANGCPPLTNYTAVGIPWIEQYNNPGALIPTNPPLLTGTHMTGNIVSQGLNCTNINASIPPPPYDLTEINNSNFQANLIKNVLIEDTYTPIELCKANCYSTPYCSGATYTSATQNCALMTGSGSMKAQPGSTAIVPKLTQYILALSQLNLQLTQINDQIMTNIKTGEGDFQKYTNDTEFDNNLLKNRYTKLMKERERIDEVISSISKTNQEEQLYETQITDSNYLKYTLLIALAIIIIIFLSNISRSEQIQNVDKTFNKSLIFIIILIIVIVFGVLFLRTYVTNSPI